MKFSKKGIYALMSMTALAKEYQDKKYTSLISIAQKYDLSKIYLEQVFVALKRSGMVVSTIGAQGGYRLNRPPEGITAYDILSEVESLIFEKNDKNESPVAEELNRIFMEEIFNPLDEKIINHLKSINLRRIVDSLENQKEDFYNYYI